MTYKFEKRFEYYTKDGKAWTSWFPCSEEPEDWQVKGRLRNEYRETNKSGSR